MANTMYINFTNHCIDRVVLRHPVISKMKVRKYAEEEARVFLEQKLREWLWVNTRDEIRRKNDWKWGIILTDWKHKIVYTKNGIWEVTIITYWYKTEASKLEWRALKIIPPNYKSQRKTKYKIINERKT